MSFIPTRRRALGALAALVALRAIDRAPLASIAAAAPQTVIFPDGWHWTKGPDTAEHYQESLVANGWTSVWEFSFASLQYQYVAIDTQRWRRSPLPRYVAIATDVRPTEVWPWAMLYQAAERDTQTLWLKRELRASRAVLVRPADQAALMRAPGFVFAFPGGDRDQLRLDHSRPFTRTGTLDGRPCYVVPSGSFRALTRGARHVYRPPVNLVKQEQAP